MIRLLRKACLKPNYSLRYQLWVSFGSISTVAILVIVSTSIAVSVTAGNRVHHHANSTLTEQVIRTVQLSSASVADTVSRRSNGLSGTVSLLRQVTHDRIVGENWATDENVPFVDIIDSATPKYPLAPVPLPPDWNITVNVNEENYQEHVQEERKTWYGDPYVISTKHATFRFQGQCDPSAVEGDWSYYPNCTDANNDVATAGVVHPVAPQDSLHEKVGFLQYILKPLYEAQVTIKLLGVYFVNEGAGASVVYPARRINSTGSYISGGCQWMLNNTNKLTNRPLGTPEMVQKCHAKGKRVNSRNYNPMERLWCQNQAIAGGDAPVVFGPYLDAFEDVWLVSFGQAVFDRITGEFIACTLADVSIEHTQTLLQSLAQEETNIFLIGTSGAIIATSNDEPGSTSGDLNKNVTDVGFEVDEFEKIREAVTGRHHHDDGQPHHPSTLLTTKNGMIVAAYPIPTPPVNRTNDYYEPNSILIMAVSDSVFAPIHTMEDAVQEDVSEIVAISAGLGAVGLFVALCLTWLVAHFLTQPFQWMEGTAKRIIYSEDIDYVRDKPFLRWTPKTEITTLVDGFTVMIQGFSKEGPATIAQSGVLEIANTLECHEDFAQLYWRNDNQVDSVVEKESHQPAGLQSEESAPLASGEATDEGPAIDEPTARDVSVHPPRDLSLQLNLSLNTSLRKSKSFHSSIKFAAEDLDDATESSLSSDDIKKLADVAAAAKPPLLPPVEHPFDTCDQRRIPKRIHRGQNINPLNEQENKKFELHKTVNKLPRIRRSPLFWWILILIVIPLFFTIYTISHIVSRKITRTLPALLDETNEASLALEKFHVGIVAQSRAEFAGEVLEEPVRDLHLYKRVAEWLLLDVIARTDAFTLVDESTEECKVYPNKTCPFYNDSDRSPCDCDWGFPRYGRSNCSRIGVDPRMRQWRYWASQSNDADERTGNRNSTSYPLVDTSPESTNWWSDISEVPGAEKGSNASGYETTYDRIRVLSAISVVEFPIFNYDSGDLARIKHLGMFVGLEADGMLTGSSGCDYSHAEFSRFQSSEENGAHLLRPELCPLKKYGYDARCRGWYADGKALGETHITSPYKFAASPQVAMSVTAPIYDPIANVYLGQALLDFIPDGLVERLSGTNVGPNGTGSVIMISPHDVLGGDTVIAPNYVFGEESAPDIVDALLPYDEPDSENRNKISTLVDDMKNGNEGNCSFSRTTESGAQERIALYYVPVYVRTVETINASVYERGINETRTLVFSLGIIIPEEDLAGAFDENVEDELWGLIIIYLVISGVTAIMVAVTTSMVAISVTQPVMILCSIVKSINEGDIDDDIPPMNGGSREVNQVYSSFAKLYKIVRFSNTAFFSGNHESALKFLTDALKLYRNVDDQKAVGICCNNLGNTYLSLYLSRRSGAACCCVSGKCVKVAAFECYNEAIDMASKDYEFAVSDDRVNDATRSEYARQLANRHFNRGIFLLLTSEDKCATVDSEDLALQDIESAAMLDTDVRNFWIRTRSVKTNSERYFDRLIRRGNGLVSCMESGSEDIDAFLHEADSLLCCIGKDSEAPLIQTMKLGGRLQQLEEVAIRNELRQGNVDDAARFAVRMLMEDEYLVESAFSAAAEALLQSMKSCDEMAWNPNTVETTKSRFREMLKVCKGPVSVPSLEKNLVLCLDANVSLEDESLQAMQRGAIDLYHRTCCGPDQVSLVVFGDTVDEGVSFDLTKKSAKTTNAIDGLAISPAPGMRFAQPSLGFHRALNSAEDCPCATWIVLATDGESWSDWSDWNSVHSRSLEVSRDKMVHLLVVGINLSERMKSNFRSICRQGGSALIEATDDATSISEAFAEAATTIEGGITLRGFTTEKF